ncbi:MAG: cytochrome bd-I oxidase subunit CydX [Alphaproteobacteria bacterium]|jgi:cyd operon protein YbgT|nr:cytochrome bd-I oxidase subunit CydX [Alphaproteobacteria bacterium]
MWYFAWLLGLPLAAAFAVLNAIWLEMRMDNCLAEEGDCPVGDHDKS